MPDQDNAELPVAPASPPLTIAVAVLCDVAYVALTAGWVVTRSWGWAAVSATALASQLALQRLAVRRRRADKPAVDSPWWSTTSIIVADLVLPIIAVINWDPSWHGWIGALLLTMNGGILILATVQARRWDRREHL